MKDINNKSILKGNDVAYVTWMAFKTPEKDKVSGLYMVKNSFYQTDRIISPRRFINRCTLVPMGKKKVHSTIFLNSQCDRCRHQVYVMYACE